MSTLVLLASGLLFSVAALEYFPIPWILIAVCWLSLFLILTLITDKKLDRIIWFNLGFAAFLLGALEVRSYFSLKEIEKEQSKYTHVGERRKEFFIADEILGYSPLKGKIITAKKFYENQLLYDVTYTIGSDGLRITPPGKSHPDNECIVFFGGSFTFGQGVNDESVMPYIVGTLQDAKVYNFGFNGYGPHQMLAAIENDMVNCKPKLAVYQAAVFHIERSAGYVPWDRHGPRYILRDGDLLHDGHFDDRRHEISILNQLKKSSIYEKHISRRITEYDFQLFFSIVAVSRSKLAEKFPGIEFHVILWDPHPDGRFYLKVRNGFESLSIRFHLVSDMLPGCHENKAEYEISRYDNHPNSVAHRLIAEYVVKNIIGAEKPHIAD